MRRNLGNRVFDNLDPPLRNTFLIFIVVKRNNLVLQQIIDSSCIELVLITLILIGTLLSECPAGTLTIAFQPPAILHTEVHNTVHLSLLTRGTRGLQRTCWSVHPDINTRNQTTSQQEVVVLQEDDLTHELRTLRDLEYPLNQTLSCTISRVSLTCKKEYNGMLWIVDNLAETIEIGKQQVSTLVSSETTAEANHQCIGIELTKKIDYT